MSTQVSTVGLRLKCLKSAAALPQQEKINSLVVQRSRVNIALSVQKPLALAAIYLLRVVKENGRLAPTRVSQAEKLRGSIRRDGLPARLGAHWEGGLYTPVR
jgi:hypothetical protein